jgi:hypothetical protein
MCERIDPVTLPAACIDFRRISYNPEKYATLCQTTSIHIITNLVEHSFGRQTKAQVGKNEGPTVHISKDIPNRVKEKGRKEIKKKKSPHQH